MGQSLHIDSDAVFHGNVSCVGTGTSLTVDTTQNIIGEPLTVDSNLDVQGKLNINPICTVFTSRITPHLDPLATPAVTVEGQLNDEGSLRRWGNQRDDGYQ